MDLAGLTAVLNSNGSALRSASGYTSTGKKTHSKKKQMLEDSAAAAGGSSKLDGKPQPSRGRLSGGKSGFWNPERVCFFSDVVLCWFLFFIIVYYVNEVFILLIYKNKNKTKINNNYKLNT